MTTHNQLDEWRTLLASGVVTHIRPRYWCGIWQLHAYDRRRNIPLVGSIKDSPEAYKIARDAGISIEDIF